MKKIELGHHDPLNYFEEVIGDGTVKPSTPRMGVLPNKKQTNPVKNKIFQIDEDSFWDYYESKLRARTERLGKYYQHMGLHNGSVIRFIVEKLAEEYPSFFSISEQLSSDTNIVTLYCKITNETLSFDELNDYKLVSHTSTLDYVDAFDALAMQVPEDLVIHYADSEKDYAGYIHLCHANGWDAEWAIGKDFGYIHKDVPRFNEMVKNPLKLVQGIIRSGRATERVGAISFRSNTELNRHPADEVEGTDKFNPEDPRLYMRLERQTITPFPKMFGDTGCFLFTIKTYFIDCNHPEPEKRDKIVEAFQKDTSKVYSSRFFDRHKEDVVKWLKGGNL